MKTGNFEITGVLRTLSYKCVYSAEKEHRPFWLHEYANPAIAAHEHMLSSYLANLSVVQFIDKTKIRGKTFLVQEHIEGQSLEKWLREEKPLEEKLSLASTILTVLGEVHEKGVIYNNLSFETVTVVADGSIVLNDLAIAVRVGDTTPVLQQLLNPHFIAPECTERVAGGPSASSDYYSFGILLYWLLTGQLPFDADNTSRLISLHVAKQALPPTTINPDIHDGLSQIVCKLLEKEQTDRYKSIEGILYDLSNYDTPGFQLASQDMDQKFRISGKIYGREKETNQLHGAVQGVADGKARLVTISGYSGVGKSTIVSEFKRTLPPETCRLISGKFQQYKKDIPYFAIVEAFEELFDLLLLSEQEILDGFRRAFSESISDQGLILTSIFPKLELIVGTQKPVDKLVGEEAENRFNYVFLKLVNIVATQMQPLVIFLDDLQWTDLVSLNVLRAVFQHDTPYLLVVLCYRSNEVNQHHPFQRFLNDVTGNNLVFQPIEVGDLRPDDVEMLIHDSLGYHHPELSDIVYQKTHGNAFFVHQLLKGLADREFFQRDVKNKVWRIDLEEVSRLEVSSNVVGFMQTRLQRLPQEVIDLVKIIGAVGHNVDLDVLSVVTGKSREHISATLTLPFEDGLLYQKQNIVYFTHDKIEQACYQLNDQNELPKLHFTIAKTLIRGKLFQSLDDLFNLVGHLDKGFSFISGDFKQYIEIYMMAALKSKEISAYQEFLIYVGRAMSLLHDDLTDIVRYEVYREYHIALYLNSRFDEADAFFFEKFATYGNILDLKENYFSKVSQDSMQRKYKEATEFGMSILQKLGIELQLDPQLDDLTRELGEVEELFAGAGITKISDLKNVEKKNIAEMEFISELILAMVPAAFFYNPTVACLLIFTTLRLALRNGVFEAMGYPLSVASTPFILIKNDYRAGFEYAEYAMQVAAGNKRSLGNSKHLFILFCWHWSRPMKDDTALEIARDAHHLLMQGGDIQMAGYTYYNTITYLWERGEKLEAVLEEAGSGLEFNRKTENLHGSALISPHYQVVRTLLSDDGDFLHLSRDGFNEEEFIRNNEQNLMGLCFFYIYKTQLAYMFGATLDAYEFGKKNRELLHYITGFPSTHSGIFYAALSSCGVLSPDDEEWETVTRDREQLHQWCEGAPENFTHKLHFLDAEIARKKDAIAEAIHCYTEALTTAKENGFLHEAALICERFSSFWQELNNWELTEYFVKKAYHLYELWGAKRKCIELKRKYQDVFFDSKSSDLDLLSVIHSQNLLAQETNTDQLLQQMMQILLEVSGAERVFLILKKDDWAIEAFTDIQGEEKILQRIPLQKEMLSVDMVNYVIRTGRIARLDQFSGHMGDNYLNSVTPQSIIVLPATVGSRMLAVIYLEHTRMKNMFHVKRQEIITLLSTQIAISLNNASIYKQQDQLVQERTQELAAQNRELVVARKKADQANEAKSEFLANMSHELRTPLNAVTGFSELLSTLVADTKQKVYLEAIKTAGSSLLTLINDILDLSKIEAGRLDISYAPVNLNMMFMEIEQIFAMNIKEKKLRFSVTLSPDFPQWLYLDEVRFRQILFNLVGNGIKFTDTGYVSLSAQCVEKGTNSVDLTVVVEDSGIGIVEEEQNRIFQSFEQQAGQDSAKYGGTGLGLAITKRLVELMNGSISVSSTPGNGSKFSIEFFDLKIASSEAKLVEEKTLTFEHVHFHPAKVLVVDDVRSNRLLLEEFLGKVGLEVAVAQNGEEAVLMVKELRPDLILMDIRMPVLSGVEATKQLKMDPKTAQIPIIALTASSTKEEKKHALRQGFDGFLGKPMKFEKLLFELSLYLGHTLVDTVACENVEESTPLCLDDVHQPQLLNQLLKNEVLPHFEKLTKAFVVSDYNQLATQLKTAAKDFAVPDLADYGSHMEVLVNTFSIQEMVESLKVYQKNILKMSVILENHDSR